MSFKTAKIIQSISRRAMLPDNESTFTTEDFLDMVDDELRYFAIPHILSAKEEYLMTFTDIDLVDGVREYTIPYRSVGSIVRDVCVVESSGHVRELTRIELDDVSDYSNGFNAGSYPHVFYLENNKIKFPYTVNNPVGSVIRIYYPLAPNQLVEEKYVGIISDIDRTTGVITLSNFPDDFANLLKMDFISEKEPNQIISFDITPSSANKNAKSLVFTTTDIPDSLEVGDHLAKAQQTMVLQLPVEFQKVVCQRVAVQALEALGDLQNKESAESRLGKMEQSVLGLIANRVQGAPLKVFPRKSILRGSLKNCFNKTRGF